MDHSIINHYFPELSAEKREKLEALGNLYAEWNERINVVSRKDIDELYERHILHSLAIAKFATFKSQTRILDIGTGGGFPGIPLAIVFPEVQFHLVDSIAKKIKVVDAIANALSLENVKAEHQRVEKIKSKYDYIVSRAVARTKKLINWTGNLIDTNHNLDPESGYLLLKGGDLNEELAEIKRPYQEQSITEYFNEPFFETKKIVYIPH